MIISELPLIGLKLIAIEPVEDDRGFFARTFCADEFAAAGLPSRFSQHSVSFNHSRGTLRGLHFQGSPHEETKLVRCSRGAIWDVAVDIRQNSATFGRWHGVELTADNRLELLIPAGFAHGFITLSDGAEVSYQIEGKYAPRAARAIRWDDPFFAIEWPLIPSTISDRDRSHADYRP